ncbi:universal stress protein [Roseobacter weihaiensis]|uniref:universal stress protein n=1 Tax=Roseobacter weihaiensis TaxID=2763262 RepID=UPI001D0A49D3|nr:universal stress protein [Roseobacter sp. H9]
MIGRILVAYDGSDPARRALDLAAEFCTKFGAEVSIVPVLMHGRPAKELVRMAEIEHMVEHVHKEHLPDMACVAGRAYDALSAAAPGNRSARIASALGNRLMAMARSRCAELGVEVAQTSVWTGDYSDEILDAASEMGSDMIALGARGLGSVKAAVPGRVTQKTLHHAAQTVVVVK